MIPILRSAAPILILAGLTLAAPGLPVSAEGTRPPANAIERYGLGGFIQPIGLHHGFHIEKVAPDSLAERDRLVPHDIIVKVDGEEIRSLEHLRTLLTDIAEDDGVAELTVLKEGSLEHHLIKCHLRARPADPPTSK